MEEAAPWKPGITDSREKLYDLPPSALNVYGFILIRWFCSLQGVSAPLNLCFTNQSSMKMPSHMYLILLIH